MLVCFEKWELLEKSFPRNLVIILVFHHMLGDFHGFFNLGEHNVSGGQRNVISGVHAWESRGNDREVIFLILFVEKLLVIYVKGN